MNTFMQPEQAGILARTLNLNTDSVKKIISKSYGNYPEIFDYLRQGAMKYKNILTLPLLNVISEKDIRDTPAAILLDHLTNAAKVKPLESLSPQQYAQFILSPRIANEILSPWRGFLLTNMGHELKGNVSISPASIKAWIQKNIKIKETENYYDVPITPAGVYNLRQADPKSRNIFLLPYAAVLVSPHRSKHLQEFHNI